MSKKTGRRRVLITGNSAGGNYLTQVLAILQNREIGGGVRMVHVYHDDWCRHNSGGACNCKPVIKFE